jgi:hypothetical protein
MKRSIATAVAVLLGIAPIAATFSAIDPAVAGTSCRWEGGQLRCDDDSNSSSRDRDRRDNNDRDRRDRDDDYPYYDRNEERYQDRYNDRNNRNSLEDRIDRVYREVLGRPADRDGLRTYVNRVRDRNWSLERVRNELAGSREAESAIDRAYQEILGRNADRNGLRTYVRRLQSGWSIQRIREDLMNSRRR